MRDFPRSRRVWLVRLWLGLCVLIAGGCLIGCEPIKPLTEALFRLNTTDTAPNCDPTAGKPPCRWEIVGVVNDSAVTDSNDNPFQDCSGCVFQQKVAIIDGKGTIHYLYYKLPTQEVIPLSPGDEIKLTYIRGDHSQQGFAVSILNKNDALVAAIASGPGGELIKDLLGEFSVVFDPQKEAGRETNDCGTKIFRELVFKTTADANTLPPGKTGTVKDSGGLTYRVGNINRYNWEGLRCENLRATPFSFFIFLTF